jgi:hypothetical protein
MMQEQIESTLVFDVDHYDADRDPRERIAEGVHERGDRKVERLYDLDTEEFERYGGAKKLRCHARYYVDGELKNQTGRMHQTHDVVDGIVQHDGVESELHEFIKANFSNDPELELTEVFEDYVY